MVRNIKVEQPTEQCALPEFIPLWTFVSVVWEDAAYYAGARNRLDFLSTWKPCIRRTAGYVIEYTDSNIFVATTDDRLTGFVEDAWDVEDINMIPIGMVRKIELPLAPRRKRKANTEKGSD